MSITIKNKLEVKAGNKIQIPGCEPLSSFSSPTLLENRKCNATLVDLSVALEAIPGSTIERFYNGGSLQRKFYFVLPEGPPPGYGCTNGPCVEDYYTILRDLGEEEENETTISDGDCPPYEFSMGQITEGFPLKGIFG